MSCDANRVTPHAGACVVGQGPRWLILHVSSVQLGNGSWRLGYSFAPGKVAYFTIVPAADMVGPHDPAIITTISGIARNYPASA